MSTITARGLTLAEKVYNVLTTDESRDSVIRTLEDRPECSGLGEFESDLRDFSTAYGIAVGLARLEEPCESISSVAARALVAANELLVSPGDVEWGSFAARPQRDALVDAVLRAHNTHGVKSIELDSAIVELGNSIGWPSSDPEAVA